MSGGTLLIKFKLHKFRLESVVASWGRASSGWACSARYCLATWEEILSTFLVCARYHQSTRVTVLGIILSSGKIASLVMIRFTDIRLRIARSGQLSLFICIFSPTSSLSLYIIIEYSTRWSDLTLKIFSCNRQSHWHPTQIHSTSLSFTVWANTGTLSPKNFRLVLLVFVHVWKSSSSFF